MSGSRVEQANVIYDILSLPPIDFTVKKGGSNQTYTRLSFFKEAAELTPELVTEWE